MSRKVILLMTDTTRCDMLGCYGNEQMHTPHLDRLAAEGLRYENAYTCQPVCGPARSAMFTGLFPHSNGMVTNSIAMGDNVKTIGQRLTDQGIHCGYIGKWHLDGSDYFGNGRCAEGWDKRYWYDMRCYLDELTEDERRLSRLSQTAYQPDMAAEFTYAHRCSDRALRFLEENKDDDFFLVVSYDEPHGPCLCPAPYNTMYCGVTLPDSKNHTDDLSQKPLMQQLWAGASLHPCPPEPNDDLALFLGCNSFADAEMGRVLDKIRTCCPDALVIYTSDHGDLLGNHRLYTKNAAAYKEVANIPLLIKGGTTGVVTAPASHIDLVPTVLDYMGLPIPKVLEGKSMLAQLHDPTVTVNDVVFTEFTRYEVDHDGFGGLQPMRAATSERYKLVLHLTDTDEFYDLLSDPAEVENLIEDESTAAERNRLHDRILQHMDDTRDLFRGYQWACRPWRTDKKPTWYNGGYTRQRENEEYEPRQLDYDTGLPMEQAVRNKSLY